MTLGPVLRSSSSLFVPTVHSRLQFCFQSSHDGRGGKPPISDDSHLPFCHLEPQVVTTPLAALGGSKVQIWFRFTPFYVCPQIRSQHLPWPSLTPSPQASPQATGSSLLSTLAFALVCSGLLYSHQPLTTNLLILGPSLASFLGEGTCWGRAVSPGTRTGPYI